MLLSIIHYANTMQKLFKQKERKKCNISKTYAKNKKKEKKIANPHLTYLFRLGLSCRIFFGNLTIPFPDFLPPPGKSSRKT